MSIGSSFESNELHDYPICLKSVCTEIEAGTNFETEYMNLKADRMVFEPVEPK